MQLNSPGSAGLALIMAVFIACALAARGQDPINEAPLPSSTDYTVAQTNAAPPPPSSPYAVDTYNSKGGAPVGENVLRGTAPFLLPFRANGSGSLRRQH